MANAEAVAQARSALLPQVTLGTQTGKTSLMWMCLELTVLEGTEIYTSSQFKINASQAYFNYQSWAKVQQAKASVKAAHATFNNAAQDLILRTAKAYFDVLFSRDTLNFVEAKKTG